MVPGPPVAVVKSTVMVKAPVMMPAAVEPAPVMPVTAAVEPAPVTATETSSTVGHGS